MPTVAPAEILSSPKFPAVAALLQDRLRKLGEFTELSHFFFRRPKVDPAVLLSKKMKVDMAQAAASFDALLKKLPELAEESWTVDGLREFLLPLAAERGWKNGQLLWPMRAALTGESFSPGAFECAAILGKEETLARLRNSQLLTVNK